MEYSVKYSKVYDKDGNIVDISTVTPENKQAEYYSIGTKTPMIAALGEKNKHYFRAKRGYVINGETELHEYAKKMLKYRFDNQENFFIELFQREQCTKRDKCIFYDHLDEDYRGCGHIDRRLEIKIDLKKYYDTATLEGYYKGFIADVLLTSSDHPDREPVFLEVAVTHKCEEEKIQSKIRIIELVVRKEEDVYVNISQDSYMRAVEINFYNFKDNSPKDGCEHFAPEKKRSQLTPQMNNRRPPTIYYCQPQVLSPTPIQAYYDILEIGMLFASKGNEYWYVFEKTLSNDKKHLIVMCQNVDGTIFPTGKWKTFAVYRISWSGKFFTHKTRRFVSFSSAWPFYDYAKERDWDDIE